MLERTKLPNAHLTDFLTRLENDATSYFVGLEDRPLWLTRLVIGMVLGHVTKSNAQSVAPEEDDRAVAP